jgi:tetratricopeptide (TPR) repeat protein
MVRQGNLDGAIVHYREALRLNPNLTDARRNLELVLAPQDPLPTP